MVIQFPIQKYSIVDRRNDMVDDLFIDFTRQCVQMGCSLEDEVFLENASEVLFSMRRLVDDHLGLYESFSEEQFESSFEEAEEGL